mmetsp:Transcript_13920/g.28498  ORF Transcript_13920/g.28498 Transcript_13920/m.28498 type:complete len:111 (+) Transcript_13920:1779-2111(+)
MVCALGDSVWLYTLPERVLPTRLEHLFLLQTSVSGMQLPDRALQNDNHFEVVVSHAFIHRNLNPFETDQSSASTPASNPLFSESRGFSFPWQRSAFMSAGVAMLCRRPPR